MCFEHDIQKRTVTQIMRYTSGHQTHEWTTNQKQNKIKTKRNKNKLGKRYKIKTKCQTVKYRTKDTN